MHYNSASCLYIFFLIFSVIYCLTEKKVHQTPSDKYIVVKRNIIQHIKNFDGVLNNGVTLLKRVYPKLFQYDASNISSFDNFDIIEDIMLHLFTLSQLKSTYGVMSYILGIFKNSSLVDGSLTEFIMETFGLTTQSDEGDGDKQWPNFLSQVRSNWIMCRDSNLFSSFATILGLMVTFGMCKSTDVVLSTNFFKLHVEQLQQQFTSADDVIKGILNCAEYFCTNLYAIFKNGDFSQLFASSNVDKEFCDLRSNWEMYKNGNLLGLRNMSDADFAGQLSKVKQYYDKTYSGMRPSEVRIMMERKRIIDDIDRKFSALKKSCGLRRAPFVLELFGASAQGKSSLCDQLIHCLLLSENLSTDMDKRGIINPSEKYWNNWKSDKLVLVIDDLGNEKVETMQTNPIRSVIDVCNNMPFIAPKAGVEEKGEVFVEPELVMITTNVEDLNATAYSNCPYSIQRRPHFVLDIKAKDDVQYFRDGRNCGIDPAKARGYPKKNGLSDFWDITVKVAVQPTVEASRSKGSYETYVWDSKEFGTKIRMEKVGMNVLIPFLVSQFRIHRDNQVTMLKNANTIRQINTCPVDGCNNVSGFCFIHDDLKTQVAYSVLNSSVMYSVICFLQLIEPYLFHRWIYWMLIHTRVYMFLDRCLLSFNILPMFGTSNSNIFKRCYTSIKVIFEIFVYNLVRFSCLHCLNVPWYYILLYIFISCYLRLFMTYRSLIHVLALTRGVHNVIGLRNYSKYLYPIVGGISLLAVIRTFKKIYTSYNKIEYFTQGGLCPRTEDEYDRRNDAVNPWTYGKPVINPLIATNTSKTTSLDTMNALIGRNLVNIELVPVDSNNERIRTANTKRANGLFIQTGVLLIPHHYLREYDRYEAIIIKGPLHDNGANTSTYIDKARSYKFPDRDLTIVHVSSGGKFSKMSKHFAHSYIDGETDFEMQYRTESGEIVKYNGNLSIASRTEVIGKVGKFEVMGSKYNNLSRNTFDGLCGAVCYSTTGVRCIIGIHVAGREGTTRGMSCLVTNAEIDYALSKLPIAQHSFLMSPDEPVEHKTMGRDNAFSFNDNTFHNKNPNNYLPLFTQVEVVTLGPKTNITKSSVVKSCIYDDVLNTFQITDKWGPPDMLPDWKPYQSNLEKYSNPGSEFPDILMDRARSDYIKPLLELLKCQKEYQKHIMRPLTILESINGIPGVKYIDRINMNTSMGHPIHRPKKNFIHPECNIADTSITFTQEVMDYIEETDQTYRLGKIVNPIVSASKKDEVKETKSDGTRSCRIFFGAPIAFIIVCRKYFLCPMRFLQMNSLTSECAIGANVYYHEEWTELYSFIMQFGEHRAIGGDYSSYDARQPTMVISSALSILMELAWTSGNYTSVDMQAMESICTDIIYPNILMDNFVYRLNRGGHISGNPLTTMINSIVNCLQIRMAYFDKFDTPFRENVKLMTYGDDNIGSVSPCCSFNNVHISEFLDRYGQIFTDTSKEVIKQPYLSSDNLTFLKRSNCEFRTSHGDVVQVGRLDINSVFKSLLYVLPSKSISHEHQISQIIDAACYEAFFYGRVYYNVFVGKLNSIIIKYPHILTFAVLMSYDEMLYKWEKQYCHYDNHLDLFLSSDSENETSS